MMESEKIKTVNHLRLNLLQNVTYIGHQAHLFMGSVRSNLAMGNPEATEEQLWHALEQVNLALMREMGVIVFLDGDLSDSLPKSGRLSVR